MILAFKPRILINSPERVVPGYRVNYKLIRFIGQESSIIAFAEHDFYQSQDWEEGLSRVIKTEGSGRDRNRLCREVVLAVRELMRQTEPDLKSKDLAAFIAKALLDIYNTIDPSVVAWEKRGYWVKADRFRLEWEWSHIYGCQMRKAVLEDDWMAVATICVQIAQKLTNIQISNRHHLGTPWEGAFLHLLQSQSEVC